MINVANQINAASNIRYVHSDVFGLNSSHFSGELFSKVLMYGALQHLNRGELERLLNLIIPFCEEHVLFVFGFIPNQEKKWRFYDTFLKKTKALYYKISGHDLIGTWWSKHEIERRFNSVGMQCQFADIPKGRYGFPYRFHVVARRK
ncbi:MAG: hypothetical protein JKX81_07855 [Arenicella sp.]|nr:hypothetical protein [Arenicella sp.]